MKTQNGSESGIPGRFELSAYDSCATWTLAEWRTAITDRHVLRRKWRYGCLDAKGELVKSKFATETIEMVSQYLYNPTELYWLHGFHERPNEPSVRDQVVLDCVVDAIPDNDERYRKWVDAIEDWNLINSLDDGDDHDDHEAESEPDYESIRASAALLSTTSAWKMHREIYEFDKRFFVGVDLRAHDSQIMKDFRCWLRKTRSASSVKLPSAHKDMFVKDMFKDWHRYRVLPYLDLTFYFEVNRVETTLETISRALFPAQCNFEFDPLERVRKTTQKYANLISSDAYVSALNEMVNNTDADTGQLTRSV